MVIFWAYFFLPTLTGQRTDQFTTMLLALVLFDAVYLAEIVRAFEVARAAHEGQMRRSGDPYITHPVAVATILAEIGVTGPTLLAALLHDTVEDTDYSLERLRADFGSDVALLVDGVTKLDKVTYGAA
ncbi:HD domain-containing protein, partial [Xanthomonas citri pv. citri]|nr:HD domain-containing protein [Xanthomonas citri pv. citri]